MHAKWETRLKDDHTALNMSLSVMYSLRSDFKRHMIIM